MKFHKDILMFKIALADKLSIELNYYFKKDKKLKRKAEILSAKIHNHRQDFFDRYKFPNIFYYEWVSDVYEGLNRYINKKKQASMLLNLIKFLIKDIREFIEEEHIPYLDWKLNALIQSCVRIQQDLPRIAEKSILDKNIKIIKKWEKEFRNNKLNGSNL